MTKETSSDGRPRGALTVRVIAMPADTNANGDIFGGWVLSRMDQAGGIAGVERARGRVVTIAVDAMTFIQPVRVGDVLEVYSELEKVGRTSMKIHIEAWARRFMTHHHEKVTDANFTFVAIVGLEALRPGLDVDLHRGAPDALDLGVDLQHIADAHRADEGHRPMAWSRWAIGQPPSEHFVRTARPSAIDPFANENR